MPKGPKGEKRPADVIGAAVKVMQIAAGEAEAEIEDDGKDKADTIKRTPALALVLVSPRA